METMCRMSAKVLEFEGWLVPKCEHRVATSSDADVVLSDSEAARPKGALGHWITLYAPPNALRLSWNTAEISKYQPLLLKLSQVSGLRRMATCGASALKVQTQPSSPSNGLVQRRIVWRLLDLLIGYPLAYVTCLHFRSLRLPRATLILNCQAACAQEIKRQNGILHTYRRLFLLSW
jgi:hypothetical protein